MFQPIYTSHTVTPLSLNQHIFGTGISTSYTSSYSRKSGTRLSSDLPEDDERCFGNLAHSVKRFSLSNATHAGILTSVRSTPVSTVCFTANRTLPYQITPYKYEMNSLSSAPYLSLDHFRRRGFHPVSCYAFFKRWLLLSQLPGCLKTTTSFPTEYGFGGLRRKSGVFPFSHTSLAPHD